MSFEHAPVSKGLMIACGLTSILVGLFDVKHYFHLQLVPHISRHHQYWRLGLHHLAFSNSSDLFIAELLLYNVGVQIERQFGSVKFASFAFVSTLMATILEFIALLLLHSLGLNYIPSGPSTLLFSIIYQYSRIVPVVYRFRIFSVPLSNKSFTYLLALQSAISSLPGSAAAAGVGILAGQIYRSDLANLKAYRLPPAVVSFSEALLLPLVGTIRPLRRSNRALPDEGRTIPGAASHASPAAENDEVITTARAPAQPEGASGASVVREWVDELRGRGERTSAGIRAPSDAEIAQATGMFPSVQRDVVVAALQRSPNIEAAVEILLNSPG